MALDAWLDQLEAETAEAPTQRDLSERFMASRLTLLGARLEAVIRKRCGPELAQTEAMCGCGRRAKGRIGRYNVSPGHSCASETL